MPAAGPWIIFACFEIEHPNLEATRDSLYELIAAPKYIWDLPGGTHYFNAYEKAGLVLGDTRTAGKLADRLRQLRHEIERQIANPSKVPKSRRGVGAPINIRK